MLVFIFFFFKQKTAYEIYQCDWSSDVCSSDLSRLFDANMALEQLNATRGSILAQAGTAMLAQLNSSPQQVLQLFR